MSGSSDFAIVLTDAPDPGDTAVVQERLRAYNTSQAGHDDARPLAVLGNEAARVDTALGKLPVERVRNPAFAEGLSSSLKAGLTALPPDIDGVLVCLGDMPLVAGRDLDRLIAAFNPLEGRAIIVPTRHGKRGNPVLWARRFFPEMAELAGDVGGGRRGLGLRLWPPCLGQGRNGQG